MDATMLTHMIKELQNHNRDKTKLLEFYITKRLEKSITNYYSDISKYCDYLETNENSYKVMKNLNK